MIAGGVLTITYAFFSEFGLLLFVISTIGGIRDVVLYPLHHASASTATYKDEYFVGLYGMLTGVASTGIAFAQRTRPQFGKPRLPRNWSSDRARRSRWRCRLFGLLMLPSIAAGGGRSQPSAVST
ncbi:MAG: hypothetical protein MZU97_16365 [Bacillus subtilis]|nr:hypothetical protein [Bacillus subtilis]